MPAELEHDAAAEATDVNLGVGASVGRLPFLGCDSAHAAAGIPLGYRHVRCGSSADPNLAAAAAAIAAAAAPVFVSAKIAPGQMADPAAACDALLAALKLPCLDLLSFEWPVGDATTLNAAWARMEALVDAGKTKAIGLTNASVPIVESICKAGPHTPSPHCLLLVHQFTAAAAAALLIVAYGVT